jgi:hypothetical protein
MGPPGARLTMKELYPYSSVSQSSVLKWSHVPAGDAIQDQMTYCRRCVEDRRKAVVIVDDPWDKTVQSSDRADTGPNRN